MHQLLRGCPRSVFLVAAGAVVLMLGSAPSVRAGATEPDQELLQEVIQASAAIDALLERMSFDATERRRTLVTHRPSERPDGQGVELLPVVPFWTESRVKTKAWQDGYHKHRLDLTTVRRMRGSEEEDDLPPASVTTFSGERGMEWVPTEQRAVVEPRDLVYTAHGPFSYRLIGTKRGLETVSQVLRGVAAGELSGGLRAHPENADLVVLTLGDPETGTYREATLDRRFGFQVVQVNSFRDGYLWYSCETKYRLIDSVPFPESGTAQWRNPAGEVVGVHTVEFRDLTLDPEDMGPDTFWPQLPIGTKVQDNILGAWYVLGADAVEEYDALKELLLAEKVNLEQPSPVSPEPATPEEAGGPGPVVPAEPDPPDLGETPEHAPVASAPAPGSAPWRVGLLVLALVVLGGGIYVAMRRARASREA